MFLCKKRIIYLSLYESGEKIAAAGFTRIQCNDDSCLFDIYIKKAREYCGVFPVNLIISQNEKNLVGNISLDKGNGNLSRSLHSTGQYIMLSGKSVEVEKICGMEVVLGNNKIITSSESGCGTALYAKDNKLSENKLNQSEIEDSSMLHTADLRFEQKKVDFLHKREASFSEEVFLGDKWQQLLVRYTNMHPYGDERIYISMEPKDFVLLRSDFQKLVNNSFLLHGFYNYRHIILGKGREIGNEQVECYYLGVPGVYFEREKMVAVMFGFEAFECSGEIEIGKFGYYLRKVEL